ncbi:cyclic nucleotide-binding protein [Sphingobacteriaceae bacterium]|nr:cyclic nucleotide-binding protein [Sphingobacteriaceae bacterium]
MPNLLKLQIENTIKQSLSSEQFEALLKLTFVKSYDKKDFLVEEGRSNNYIYFILKGSCYSYIEKDNGAKSVVQFALEGNWISDLCSFFSSGKAIYNVVALESTEVLAISRENFEAVCDTILSLNKYFRIIVQNAYITAQLRIAKTNITEADERYSAFSQQYPEFVQRIPQYLIAYYLGVKPQSLSRARKPKAQKK